MPVNGGLRLIDASVLVNIRDYHDDSAEIWQLILDEINQGKLHTVRHVYEELERRFPDVSSRLKPYKRRFLVPAADIYNPAVRDEIRAIHQAHPKLYAQLGGGNPADPFLIAVAKFRDGVVMTDEKRSGPKHQ